MRPIKADRTRVPRLTTLVSIREGLYCGTLNLTGELTYITGTGDKVSWQRQFVRTLNGLVGRQAIYSVLVPASADFHIQCHTSSLTIFIKTNKPTNTSSKTKAYGI